MSRNGRFSAFTIQISSVAWLTPLESLETPLSTSARSCVSVDRSSVQWVYNNAQRSLGWVQVSVASHASYFEFCVKSIPFDYEVTREFVWWISQFRWLNR